MSKYGHRNHDWSEAIVNKLGGEERAEAFLRSELVVKMAERSFAVWDTVTLGFLKSPSVYRAALKESRYCIGDYADQILNKMKVSETETQVDLVVKTVAELGFKGGANRDAIYARAKELGLELCPAEVGPALRLAYQDQPNGEWLRIAMEPISDSGGDLEGVRSRPRRRRAVAGQRRRQPRRLLARAFGRWVFVAPRK